MRLPLLVSLAALLVIGCQSALRPAPGMAALRVKVVAEPKAGSKLAERAPAVYDHPGMTATPEKGAYETVDYDNVDDIVVWLEPGAGAAAAPRTIDVNPAHSSPAVVPVSVGQKIVLRNTAAAPTPLYSVSDGNEFEHAGIPAGGSAEYTIKSPGPIEVLVSPAKDPVLRLYAAPSRFVATTRSGRSVDFADVPPGTYTVVAWHPRLPSAQSPATLAANQSAQATLKIGVNDLPKVGAR